MNLLHKLRDTEFASKDNRRISPLRAWLCAHAMSSLEKFQQLEVAGFHTPLIFQAETPLRKFVAYIDPDDQFSIEDKLSQVREIQWVFCKGSSIDAVGDSGFNSGRVEKFVSVFDIYFL